MLHVQEHSVCLWKPIQELSRCSQGEIHCPQQGLRSVIIKICRQGVNEVHDTAEKDTEISCCQFSGCDSARVCDGGGTTARPPRLRPAMAGPGSGNGELWGLWLPSVELGVGVTSHKGRWWEIWQHREQPLFLTPLQIWVWSQLYGQ